MKNKIYEKLQQSLNQFICTNNYKRHSKFIAYTDGVSFLAEQANAYWLIDLYASHLIKEIHKEIFTCLKLRTNIYSAEIVINDGNNNLLAKQKINYTDFPLPNITLYSCWSNNYWVLMLPSEY